MDAIPQLLIDATREQRAILFLGAGASIGASHPKNDKIPAGDALRDLISDKFLSGQLKTKSLVSVAAMAANDFGLPKLQKYIRELFEPFQPAEFHTLIPQFRWKALVTTNFDLIIERAYTTLGDTALQGIVKTVKDGDLFDSRMSETVSPVGFYKLHGCIDHYLDETIPLILGQEQYASYAVNRQRLYGRLRDLAYEYPIIFCGYSISDPHIQQLIFDLTDKKIQRPWYYYVAPDLSDIETRYWSSHRIQCLQGTLAEFLRASDYAIPELARKIPSDLGGGTLSIRKYYRVASAPESKSLCSYLENDVQHIHAAMVVEHQDPVKFYKGYDNGWGCIAQNLDVRRSVCDSILVDAILGSDAKPGSAELFMLKGPAGNGKTVALKRVAWDAGIIYDQLVFWVNSAAGLRREPIEEIYRLTGKRIFLFVDRIALLRNEMRSFISGCRAAGLPVSVIGAERDNEWNFYCEQLEKFVQQEFAVRYLSEKAIGRLLELLERHKALGLLATQNFEQRVKAFTERAEKQLLVALHETTLGLPFQKIVLDEYNRILPADARRIYLLICSLHQFGAKVRAGLISRMSGVGFRQFGERFLEPLENVVIVEEDKHGQDYYYSSRHRHVAELVFNQALPSDDDRYEMLSMLMGAINIDYSSDSESWRRIIRGRAVANMFANVELGRLLYDRAQELVPTDAFIYHQRAVFEMAHPGGSLVLAERAAGVAAERQAGNRSIAHTQAEIARRQAEETSDPLVKQALRRFARQKLGTGSGHSSEYDLGTRARLALDELRELLNSGRELDQAILLEATKEAQTTIQQGLLAYPESADLLSVEAQFRQLLEQAERATAALERAFNLNPRLDWLAVRLSRMYGDKNLSGAEGVLARCLEQNPGSKTAHLQMAFVLKKLGKSEILIMDHLARSFSQGDNHYDGQFWYARELFLQGRPIESKAVFDSLNEIAPGRFRTTAGAQLDDPSGRSIILRGTIKRKEEGYAFVHYIDFAVDIFASRADTDSATWDTLKGGNAVNGSLGFSRRGPRAIKLNSD